MMNGTIRATHENAALALGCDNGEAGTYATLRILGYTAAAARECILKGRAARHAATWIAEGRE